ncbi:MAG: GatB/YqeY domain-containing protein [Candidatus Omnitrophica bacterium]|nr:GatB/YqeY domain-containing protein [Candidatus Omnitrophota bacterium]
MTLEERIENEFKSALKARDGIKVSILRLLKADMNNAKLKLNKAALEDGETIKIVQRQIRQHKDSIEQFRKGKRDDLADKEEKELGILTSYMPEELSDEEVKKIIDETLKELETNKKTEMGRIMKAVMEKVKGRADGKTISRLVAGKLS